MKLYEVSKQIAEIEDSISETGEISEETLSALQDLLKAAGEKALDLGVWLKNLEAENVAYKAEMQRIKGKIQGNNNIIKRVEDSITKALKGERKKDERVTLSFIKSKQVVVNHLEALPDEYIQKKVEFSPIKKKIKEDIQEGILQPTEDNYLLEVSNLQIK